MKTNIQRNIFIAISLLTVLVLAVLYLSYQESINPSLYYNSEGISWHVVVERNIGVCQTVEDSIGTKLVQIPPEYYVKYKDNNGWNYVRHQYSKHQFKDSLSAVKWIEEINK